MAGRELALDRLHPAGGYEPYWRGRRLPLVLCNIIAKASVESVRGCSTC